MDTIESQVKAMMAQITELSEAEIDPDAHIFRDLGADSMAALEMMATLEQQFGIGIKPDEIQELVSVRKIAAVVRDKLAKEIHA